MATRAVSGSTPLLTLGDTYAYSARDKVVRFEVEWTSRTYGIICDLDLHIYCYDERARFIEKLDSGSKRTKDRSCVLVSDTDGATGQTNTFSESVKIDFRMVSKETSAIMLFLDGGPRNFQFVQGITVKCEPVAARSVIPGQAAPQGLFEFSEKSRKDFQGVALAVVFKDGWLPEPEPEPEPEADDKDKDKVKDKGNKERSDKEAAAAPAEAKGAPEAANKPGDMPPPMSSASTPAPAPAPTATLTAEAAAKATYVPAMQFVTKAIFEPVFVNSQKAKRERIVNMVVTFVPSLEKFRPRLFASVKDVCAALSSQALPGLKTKFTAIASGLPITQFTEVIYKQLFKTHPKIADLNERAYTVAMVQEMFQQIDYNGDGSADWDEFTTFCIQTASDGQSVGVGGSNIDEYIIEYQEDSSKRDRVLSPYRPVAMMKCVCILSLCPFPSLPLYVSRAYTRALLSSHALH